WSSTDTWCTRRDPTSLPGPTGAICGCRTTRRSGTPRSPGSPPRTRTPIPGTRSTWPASAGCSARCCTRSRPGSDRVARRTCCGMGGVSGALARAARMFGAQIRTDAEVAQIRTSGGRVTGVTLASGEAIDAPVVVTTAHPQISFLRLLDPAELPPGFVADIRGWRSRSGTVKINLALDKLPVFTSHPEPDPQVYGGTIVLAESLDDIETAFQQAVAGEPATLPFADICIPSVFDDSLAPAGKHIMS